MPPLKRNSYIEAERRRYRRAQDGKAWSVRDLPQYYYHKNFCDMLDVVETAHDDILGGTDKAFIDNFRALPFAAQCAYVRLCGRKGRVFQTHKFDYSEIDDLTGQYRLLRELGFAGKVCRLTFSDYLSTLPKPDLVLLLSDHVCETEYKKSWKKSLLVDVAVSRVDFDDLSVPESVVVQGYVQQLNYLLYLYFGRIEKSLQNVTLRDLGLVKPSPPGKRWAKRFDDVETAKTAYFYAGALQAFRDDDELALQELYATLDDWPVPRCDLSAAEKDKLLQKLGGLAERKGEIESALALYTRSDHPLCNERIVRLRYKQGDTDWVKQRLEDMIADPSSDDEYDFAQDYYARKFNKKRTSIVTDILRDSESIDLDEAFKNQPERAALRHFQAQSIEAYRTENTPWKNLFGLLFWDILFATDDDAPPTYHHLPTLLKTGGFYEAHKDTIDARLDDLASPSITMIRLLRTLTRHYGQTNKIIRWGGRDLDRLKALVTHAPDGALAHMLRLMARDWPATKDGYPDLMLIRDNVAEFIEIKATGDSVRRNQLTRIRQLRDAGFKAEILQVGWSVDPDQEYVVVDVETTGGRAGLHRVTEIGAVKMKGGQVIDEWSSLINPQRPIPPNITRITGITDAMVMNAPIFADVADSFATFMGDAIFAAHNVNFDYGFISAEFQMIDRRFRHPKICTCASMRKLYPGYSSYSLKNLCREFHIDLKSHHRALCDAKAAAQLLVLVNQRRAED